MKAKWTRGKTDIEIFIQENPTPFKSTRFTIKNQINKNRPKPILNNNSCFRKRKKKQKNAPTVPPVINSPIEPVKSLDSRNQDIISSHKVN